MKLSWGHRLSSEPLKKEQAGQTWRTDQVLWNTIVACNLCISFFFLLNQWKSIIVFDFSAVSLLSLSSEFAVVLGCHKVCYKEKCIFITATRVAVYLSRGNCCCFSSVPRLLLYYKMLYFIIIFEYSWNITLKIYYENVVVHVVY